MRFTPVMRATSWGHLSTWAMSRTRSLGRLWLPAIVWALVSCGDSTPPTPPSPTAPRDVTVTLASATSARVSWSANNPKEEVASYRVFRNGVNVGESATTTYVDNGLVELTTYKYTVAAVSRSGIVSPISAETESASLVAPDVTPPSIASVSPANGSSGVSLAATVKVTFSEAMDPATINAGTIILRSASGAQLSGTVAYDPTAHSAELKPASALPNASVLTAFVTTGVKDAAGNTLAAGFSWSFTTQPGAQNVTGHWSGTDAGGSIHWHLTFVQSDQTVTMSTSCVPSECRVFPLDPPSGPGTVAVGSGVPVDVSAVSGTFTDPAITFTVTLVNGRTFTFTGTVSGSIQMVGTIGGATLSTRNLTLNWVR